MAARCLADNGEDTLFKYSEAAQKQGLDALIYGTNKPTIETAR